MQCNACGKPLCESLRYLAKCLHCGAKRTHKECHPEQYTHALVGKAVVVRTKTGREITGVVERVFRTRFGMLVSLAGKKFASYQLRDCTPKEAI